jgi:hypothetical protein
MAVQDDFIAKSKNEKWHNIIVRVPYTAKSEELLLRQDTEVRKYLIFDNGICKNDPIEGVDVTDCEIPDCKKFKPILVPASIIVWAKKYVPQLEIRQCKAEGWYNNYNTFGIVGIKSTKETNKIKITFRDPDFDKYIDTYRLIVTELEKNNIEYESACLFTPDK